MKHLLVAFIYFISLFTPAFAETSASRPRTKRQTQHSQRSRATNSSANQQKKKQVVQQGRYWLSMAIDLVHREYVTETPQKYDLDILNADYALETAKKKAGGDVSKAVVCSKDGKTCVPSVAFGQAVIAIMLPGLFKGASTQGGAYGGLVVDKASSLTLMRLIKEYGVAEQSRNQALDYFYTMVKQVPTNCDRQEAMTPVTKKGKKVNYCAEGCDAMVMLALLSTTKKEKIEATEKIYQILKNNYRSKAGAMVLTSAVTAFGVLGSPEAYHKLRLFLTKDTLPSASDVVSQGYSAASGTSIAATAQMVADSVEVIRGKAVFLNLETAKFQYLANPRDDRAAGLYRNVFQDVGKMLGMQGASTDKNGQFTNQAALNLGSDIIKQAGKIAKEKKGYLAVNWPLVAGILEGWMKKGKFFTAPEPELLNFLYAGDWVDLNEVTQRSVHTLAYSVMQGREIATGNHGTWAAKKPILDKAKANSDKVRSTVLKIAKVADVVLAVLSIAVTFCPALSEGFVNAISKLRNAKKFVGAPGEIGQLVQKNPARYKAPAAKDFISLPEGMTTGTDLEQLAAGWERTAATTGRMGGTSGRVGVSLERAVPQGTVRRPQIPAEVRAPARVPSSRGPAVPSVPPASVVTEIPAAPAAVEAGAEAAPRSWRTIISDGWSRTTEALRNGTQDTGAFLRGFGKGYSESRSGMLMSSPLGVNPMGLEKGVKSGIDAVRAARAERSAAQALNAAGDMAEAAQAAAKTAETTPITLENYLGAKRVGTAYEVEAFGADGTVFTRTIPMDEYRGLQQLARNTGKKESLDIRAWRNKKAWESTDVGGAARAAEVATQKAAQEAARAAQEAAEALQQATNTASQAVSSAMEQVQTLSKSADKLLDEAGRISTVRREGSLADEANQLYRTIVNKEQEMTQLYRELSDVGWRVRKGEIQTVEGLSSVGPQATQTAERCSALLREIETATAQLRHLDVRAEIQILHQTRLGAQRTVKEARNILTRAQAKQIPSGEFERLKNAVGQAENALSSTTNTARGALNLERDGQTTHALDQLSFGSRQVETTATQLQEELEAFRSYHRAELGL